MQSMNSKVQYTDLKTKKVIVLQDTRTSSATYSNLIANQLQPIKLDFKQNPIKNNSIQSVNHNFSQLHPDQPQPKQQINNLDNIIIASILQFNEQIQMLNERIRILEQRVDQKDEKSSNANQQIKIKRQRRKYQDMVKQYHCEVEGCNKTYGSDISLKLHIKLKHNVQSKNNNKLVNESNTRK